MHNLTQDDFDSLLTWLDSNRQRAAERYLEIRDNLTQFFLRRGCIDSEDLADETLNRVAHKLESIRGKYVGDPISYFYAVAKNVFHEYLRLLRRQPQPMKMPDAISAEEMEIKYKILDVCLERLEPEERDMILSYYDAVGKENIEHRKAIAEKYGLSQATLRKRVQRLRSKLAYWASEEMAKLDRR